MPENEASRLAKIDELAILDTLPEREYEDLVALAAEICQTPVAQISLVAKDRQWYKAEYGIKVPGGQTPRSDAFCAHTILDPDRPLVVTDLRRDERFRNNKFVAGEPHVVFYAGFPLRSEEGYALGTLCVLDQKPRQITEAQQRTLARLSRQVVKLFELRRSLRQSQLRLREREYAYRLLSDFSHIIAHDLKAPVRNIRQAAEILREELKADLSPTTAELLDMITGRAADASSMIDGVLRYSKVARSSRTLREPVNLRELVRRMEQKFDRAGTFTVEYTGSVDTLHSSSVALNHIFQNLIGNAVKFNDKPHCRVRVDANYVTGRGHVLTVHDNGPGIPDHQTEAVFNLFHSAVDDSRRGHGVGLSIVRRLVEDLGGTVTLTSELGRGTAFTIILPDQRKENVLMQD